MNKINYSIWFLLTFLVLYVSVNEAKLSPPEKNVNIFDLEWIKNDLFSKTNFDFASGDARNQWQCIAELNAIKRGLTKSQLWAMKRK